MTTPKRNGIDLHTHTTRSDGVLEPLALFEAMRRYGTRIAAFTDHDTLDGYRELRAGKLGLGGSGPLVVPGIEINTLATGTELDWPGELHILGYGIDVDDPQLNATLRRQRDLRRERFRDAVDVLRRLGMPIDDVIDAIVPTHESASLGRPHLAQALVLKGYATSVQDAFARILAVGKAGYVARFGINTRDAIDAITSAGGLPVLAHFREALANHDVVDRLMSWGLAGLEVYYGGGRHGFDPAQVDDLAVLAAERNLVTTGGSDYHGHAMDDARPVAYADAQALTHVPDEIGDVFLAALERREAFAS